jgi:hypothetical protein
MDASVHVAVDTNANAPVYDLVDVNLTADVGR